MSSSPSSIRVVVIGGSGQIGGWLLHELAQRGHLAVGTYATVPFPGLVALDAAEPGRGGGLAAVAKTRRGLLPGRVHLGRRLRARPGPRRAANLEQPLNLARASADSGARFVYFSTDYVFDGRSGPYAETDPPRPLSVYGQAKLDAETAITDTLGASALIVRTTWVFGPERQGKNFAYQLAKTLKEGRPLICPSDQISNPSYGPDVAAAVVSLVEAGHSGLVHVAGPDWIDRVTFAQALANAFGLDASLIEARTTESLGQPAARPLKGGLRTELLDQWLPGALKPLGPTLDDFRSRLKQGGDLVRPLE